MLRCEPPFERRQRWCVCTASVNGPSRRHRENGQLRLNKSELDGPHKDRKCKHFDDDFYIEIFFDTSPSCEVN